MKTFILFNTRLSLIPVLVLSLGQTLLAQESSTELHFGEATNGVYGIIELVSNKGRTIDLIVSVTNSQYAGPFGGTNEAQMDEAFRRTSENVWEYYMATNSFCGPVELRDNLGRVLESHRLDPALVAGYRGPERPLDPEISSRVVYPETYSWRREHDRYFGQFNAYMGARVFPMPVMAISPRTELASFQITGEPSSKQSPVIANPYNRRFRLTDFYDLKAPGEYKFTVWPVVYKVHKTAGTNDDICHRIDVPPVTAVFKWDGAKPK